MTGDRYEQGGTGELGRRVARLRKRLGLSVEEVAARAHMDPGYIHYIEHRPVHLSTESLLQLADALETGVATLLGDRIERDPHSGPASGPLLEELHVDECLRLLAKGGIGRVVTVTEHGPIALPVNYVFADGGIVFRTARGTDVAAISGADVGFEVDHLDMEHHRGWSVLVAGAARRINDPAVIWRLRELVKPWAGGEHDVYIRIDPRRVSGRRIGAG